MRKAAAAFDQPVARGVATLVSADIGLALSQFALVLEEEGFGTFGAAPLPFGERALVVTNAGAHDLRRDRRVVDAGVVACLFGLPAYHFVVGDEVPQVGKQAEGSLVPALLQQVSGECLFGPDSFAAVAEGDAHAYDWELDSLLVEEAMGLAQFLPRALEVVGVLTACAYPTASSGQDLGPEALDERQDLWDLSFCLLLQFVDSGIAQIFLLLAVDDPESLIAAGSSQPVVFLGLRGLGGNPELWGTVVDLHQRPSEFHDLLSLAAPRRRGLVKQLGGCGR